MTRSDLVVSAILNSKYTIQQWSRILGVTRDTVHKWLSGANNPKRSTVIFIGEVLGKEAVWKGKNDVEFIDSGKPAPTYDLTKKSATRHSESPMVEELMAQVQYLRKRVQELEALNS